MRRVDQFQLPHEQKKVFVKATSLVWLNVLATGLAVLLLYLVKGNSKAMQAAWLESLVSLVPPVSFLITSRIFDRQPSARFPFGFHRATSIGHLAGSIALLAMGTYILFSSVTGLFQTHYPAIGTTAVFGPPIWLGWLMIPVLVYDIVAMSLLGRAMLPLANQIHDKELYVIAKMNKADWLSDTAAMIGVIGIGFGIWWADSLAAAVIGLDVFKDGVVNVRTACTDLLDATPTTPDRKKVEPVVGRVEAYLGQLDWVDQVAVRLRDEGHAFFGDAFVVPRNDTPELVQKIAEAAQACEALDWKLQELTIMPVPEMPPHLLVEGPPLAQFEAGREYSARAADKFRWIARKANPFRSHRG